MYKAYAQMSGRRVQVSPSRTVEGFASLDREARRVVVLIGRHGDPAATGPVRLELLHLADVLSIGNDSTALGLRVYPFAAAGLDPLQEPKTVFSGTPDVNDDSLAIPLKEFGSTDAYQIEVRAGTE